MRQISKYQICGLAYLFISKSTKLANSIILRQIMQEIHKQKHFKLGGMYHLTVGDLYERDCLKDLKEELQAIHGVKLQRACTENELIFICKNGLIKYQKNTTENQNQEGKTLPAAQNENSFKTIAKNQASQSPAQENVNTCRCGYYVRFLIQFRIKRQVYKLQNFNLVHTQNCYSKLQAVFLRNRRQITLHSGLITRIVSEKLANQQECSNPISVLDVLCKETGLEQDFIYKGVEDNMIYKRKLKKKLDNIIAEAKKNSVTSLACLNVENDQNSQNLINRPLSNTSIEAPNDTNKKTKVKLEIDQEAQLKRKIQKTREKIGQTNPKQGSKRNKFEVGQVPHKRRKPNQEFQQFSFNWQRQSFIIEKEQAPMNCVTSTISLYETSEVNPSSIDPALFIFPEQSSGKNFRYPFGDDQINYTFCIKLSEDLPKNSDRSWNNSTEAKNNKPVSRRQLAIL